MTAPTVLQETVDRVLFVTLNRPEVRNAFDADLIAECTRTFRDAAMRDDVVALVLRGAGKSFCAGADLNWMKAAAGFGFDENFADARRLFDMFGELRSLPFLTVACVHGAALGGGGGLVAAVDVALATESAKFGFTEVRLGIIPAVISPFVLEKIGAAHARRYFTTGEIFEGARAREIGLVSETTPGEDTEVLLQPLLKQARAVGPGASMAAKNLIEEVSATDRERIRSLTAERIAAIRGTAEAQEGMTAFLEKRAPRWREDTP